MKTVDSISALREDIRLHRMSGKTIAFVPTMGNLHQGHIELVHEAKRRADYIVCSIFVNPMQFGANEDIDSYPRTLEADKRQLIEAGANLLFTPTPNIIYPKGTENCTYVEVPDVSAGSCGESRPGHFRGVATVVCKLFNLVQPDIACFGLKDYQQVQVIQTMVDDLSIPVEIVPVETVREASGLALSSRNGYLTDDEKAIAPALYKTLHALAEKISRGSAIEPAVAEARNTLNETGFSADYINVCHARTLAQATSDDKELVILAAAHLGKARLIDNIQLERV